MLHILTTLLATALLTVSTGANALKENKESQQNQMFSLRTEPKRAYYDPEETYGTETGKIYYYSSETLLTPQASNFPINYSFSTGASPDLAFAPNGTYEEVSALEPVKLDFYVDGSFSQTIETSVTSMGPDYARKTNLYSFYSTIGLGHYIWVFDHQEPMTPQDFNEDIFTAVGDTIEGLSDALTKPWDGILNIFYDTTENEVTQMGYLVLIGLGVSITLLVFWTILRLFRQRN